MILIFALPAGIPRLAPRDLGDFVFRDTRGGFRGEVVASADKSASHDETESLQKNQISRYSLGVIIEGIHKAQDPASLLWTKQQHPLSGRQLRQHQPSGQLHEESGWL